MKICGFSFVRNAEKFSYPVIESVQSVLPLCDRFIMNVGNSEDDTLDLIRSIPSDKIEIMESTWNDSLRRNGEVLSEETNKAFDRIPEEYDWAFYIQADEVVHEKYHPAIRRSMEEWLEHPEVEALLFRYLHFFGSYNYNADSRSWYRHEIRIIRNNKAIRSYRDAQGFRLNNRKLWVKPVHAYMYHYGWVRPPEIMQQKHVNFNRFYHNDQWVERKVNHARLYDYSSVESITRFRGTHPRVMLDRINRLNWEVNLDENRKLFKPVDRILHWIEQKTGKRLFEYRNYKMI
jgi:hypothetical protein